MMYSRIKKGPLPLLKITMISCDVPFLFLDLHGRLSGKILPVPLCATSKHELKGMAGVQ